jgi:hypothetical protein
MTLKNKLCVLFIFLIHCCTGFWSKKSFYPKKKDFTKTIPPKFERGMVLNNSHNEFGVKICNGKLEIEKPKKIINAHLKLKMEHLWNGWWRI